MAKTSNISHRRRRRSATQKPMRFTRMLASVVPKVAADTGYFYAIRLSDFTYSDIQNLFQEYRLVNVKFTVRIASQLNNNADFPTLFYAPLKYSTVTSTPTNRDEVMQIKGVKEYQFGPSNNSVSFSVNPVTFAAGLTTSGVGYAPAQGRWFTTDSINVVHNCFALWISRYNTATSPTHTIDLDITGTFEAKGTK